MGEQYDGPPFDLGMGFHCGELHKRIGELLTMLSKQVGYPLVECTRCGDVMISQTPDNGVTNEAMDACGRCSYELFYVPAPPLTPHTEGRTVKLQTKKLVRGLHKRLSAMQDGPDDLIHIEWVLDKLEAILRGEVAK